MENIVMDKENREQMMAYDLIANTNSSFFLTGRAGTGKTTFLRNVQQTVKKNFVTLAPTGVAAILAGGETIHSFFGLPMEVCGPGVCGKLNEERIKTLLRTDTIIIDEVSMVRCDIVDAIDFTLRNTLHNTQPFGGKQVVFVGDLFQLSPIVQKGPELDMLKDLYHTDSFFFYKADVIKRMRLVKIEFRKVYRQEADMTFLNILENVRLNKMTYNDVRRLNSCVATAGNSGKMGITLTSRNDTAQKINEGRLEAIDAEEFDYEGVIAGVFDKKRLPAEMHLKLKVGAQVMFLRNDPMRRWANGTLAKVAKLEKNHIYVVLDDGSLHVVPLCSWDSIEYQYDSKERKLKKTVVGTFHQYPLRLAWAITVHKSQGMTFDRMYIDLSRGFFATGQLYVALSRVRSLEGLSLSHNILPKYAQTNREVISFSVGYNDEQMIKNEIESGKAVYHAVRHHDYDEAARMYLALVAEKAGNGEIKEAIHLAKRLLDTMVCDEHLYGSVGDVPAALAGGDHWTAHFLTALLALYAGQYGRALEAVDKVLAYHKCQEALYVKSRCLEKLARYAEADKVNAVMIDGFNVDTPDAKVLYAVGVMNELHTADPGIDIMCRLISARPKYNKAILTARMLMKRRGITLESQTENELLKAFNSDMSDDDFTAVLREYRRTSPQTVAFLVRQMKAKAEEAINGQKK